MKELPPDDLIAVYSGVVHGTFSACPKTDPSGRKFTKEEIAQITYDKISYEIAKDTPVPAPETRTYILGPLTKETAQATKEIIQKEFPTVNYIKKHTYLGSIYLIINGLSWIISLFDLFPQEYSVLIDPGITTIRLNHRPNSFPDEIFVSTTRTDTLCILNTHETEESLARELEAYESVIISLVIKGEKAYIKTVSEDHASNIYSLLLGVSKEGRSFFIMYYPACLSRVNLFL